MGGLPANRTVNGFAANPEDPKIMFAAMRDGLFKSTDGGATWSQLEKRLRNPATVTINSKKTNEVYAVTLDGIVFKSSNGGARWERQN